MHLQPFRSHIFRGSMPLDHAYDCLYVCVQPLTAAPIAKNPGIVTLVFCAFFPVFSFLCFIRTIAWNQHAIVPLITFDFRVYVLFYFTTPRFDVARCSRLRRSTFPSRQVSLVALFADDTVASIRSLRTLRALRPLRAISRFEGMKVGSGVSH